MHWESCGQSLHYFLHDAELERIELDQAMRSVALHFKFGYPRSEETAPRNLVVEFSGVLSFFTSVKAEGSEVSVEPGPFIEGCNEDQAYCWEAQILDENEKLRFEMFGEALWLSGSGARIIILAKQASWLTESGPMTVNELLVMGQRQWDLRTGMV